MISDKQKETAALIGEFYLRKNNGDYVATGKELESLRITEVALNDKGVVIHTSRPGILIGKRGTNIANLEKFLGVPVSIIETDNWLDFLTPFNLDDL